MAMDRNVSVGKLENCLHQAYLICPQRREPYVDMMRFYTSLNNPAMVFWAGTNALAITHRTFDFIEMSEAWTDEPYKLYINACITLGYNDVARRAFATLNNIMVIRGGTDGLSYNGLQELINSIDHPFTMVEVGSYSGEATEYFANSPKVISITAIDPWKDGEKCEHITFDKMTIVESLFDNRVGNHKKVTKIKAKIEDIDIQTFDLAYIDASHTYEAIKTHIDIVRNKVKYISGHDYSDVFPGVKKAVDEFSIKINKKVKIFSDTSWLITL
jgi:hypothetical protein